MTENGTEKLLIFIRSLISLSVGMVVAMLILAMAFWLQSLLLDDLRHDSVVSIISFLVPFLFGGIATGLANWTRKPLVTVAHGLLFGVLYLAMFIWGWIQSEEIGLGLISGLVSGGLVLAAVGSLPGLWMRLRFLRRRG
ncbi:hypothetical protein [Natronospira bacteriovora]|uniref:TIGR04086 family membrane protein n=1 Tax=Natronospira bacteriovora TaxID=3069753 RepID=A0ABU0W6W1_9GAMM|nr:hypothetical protein [Natronospira sp. AB-CW4]MDQ2069692.1 hypothetical protein [Natronospira sp. AB-CW4]